MIELYKHQKTALALLRLHSSFALFMEQGTGKTFPVLFRLAELAETGHVKKALIVAPKAVCASWDAKIRMLSDSQQAALKSIQLDIVSYDKVWRSDRFMQECYDAVIFDESHYIKTPSTKRTKACIHIAVGARYRWILTGTPTSNGQLCNLWSQFTAIDPVARMERGKTYIYPGCFGGVSYYKWLDQVAYLDQWHKPYKYKRVSEIQEVLGEMSYRISKAECLDLPEKLPDEILHCEITGQAKAHYKELMKSSAIAELDTLAGNPLTRALKLRQITSGFFNTDDGETVIYDCQKLDYLRSFLEDFEGKVVIFCEFSRSIDNVKVLLARLDMNPVVLDGRTSDKGVWQKFQDNPQVRAIICQYQSGSAGIDLFAADTMIFFEPTLRSDLLEQARDRIHRPGQTRACSYYFMLTDGTIETAIYQALCNYQDFGEALFTQYLKEYRKGSKIG